MKNAKPCIPKSNVDRRLAPGNVTPVASQGPARGKWEEGAPYGNNATFGKPRADKASLRPGTIINGRSCRDRY